MYLCSQDACISPFGYKGDCGLLGDRGERCRVVGDESVVSVAETAPAVVVVLPGDEGESGCCCIVPLAAADADEDA